MKKILLVSIIDIIMIFCVTAVVVFAWLSMNKEVGSSGPQIDVQQNTISFEYSIYKFDDELGIAYDATDDTDAFTLRPYDSIIVSRNEHLSLILKLTISGQAVVDRHTLYINVFCREQNADTLYLSNVLSFKFAYLNINESNANDLYLSAENSFSQINTKYTFINNNQKSTQINYIMNNYNNYIIDESLTLYIQVDYDLELASDIGSISYSDFESTINYGSDIYLLQIEAEE